MNQKSYWRDCILGSLGGGVSDAGQYGLGRQTMEKDGGIER